MTRLDVALVRRGLARSRNHAAQMIGAGKVRVDGVLVDRRSLQVSDETALSCADDGYVSRAAYKLIGGLDQSGVCVPARVLDAGACTGGFTQVLLRRGARTVYAIDVGHDQLAQELRDDPRVVVGEGINLRELTLADVGVTPVDLVVADVSFISLKLLLAPLFGVLAPSGEALLLVKPQFEVGRAGLDRHGVVRSERLREEAVSAVEKTAREFGWHTVSRIRSPLPGPSGNVEYFIHLRPGPPML